MTGFVKSEHSLQTIYPNIAQCFYVVLFCAFSGLRASIKEIYNNEGLAGFFRYQIIADLEETKHIMVL